TSRATQAASTRATGENTSGVTGSTAVSSGHTATRGVSSSLASVSANSKSGE
ncbi:hypothetical protein U0070_014336, partial [Myodes glareolus]